MTQFVIKVLVSALLLAAASELARRSTIAGALLVSLPLTSILALIWLWQEGAANERIAAFAGGIFWLVLPSLLLFIVMPLLLRHGVGFWSSLALSCFATLLGYAATLAALRWWDAR